MSDNLDKSFHITINFCKSSGQAQEAQSQSGQVQEAQSKPRVGLDCSVTPLRYGNVFLLQSTDSSHTMDVDPYLMGKIACANVLSYLYAMGVVDCDNMQILFATNIELADLERDKAKIPIVIGFKACALEAGAKVTRIQNVVNPWNFIGGVATSVCQANEFIIGDNVAVDDVLVLTKPLGTYVAVTVHNWLRHPTHLNLIKNVVSEEDVRGVYACATKLMTSLNRTASRLMHKYKAKGATTIAGLGLLGHARTLAAHQKNDVSFVIDRIPVLSKLAAVDKAFENKFKLLQGLAAETSGGLLICLPRVHATAFCKEFQDFEGYEAFIIGMVVKGNKTARIIDKPQIIEMPYKA